MNRYLQKEPTSHHSRTFDTHLTPLEICLPQMPISPVQLTWFYFIAFPWTVSRQAVTLRCHTGHSRLPVPGIVFKRFTQGSRRRKVFTDMLKAEKCTTCVNVSAWTMHLHQECVATVQLLKLKRFRKVMCYNL